MRLRPYFAGYPMNSFHRQLASHPPSPVQTRGRIFSTMPSKCAPHFPVTPAKPTNQATCGIAKNKMTPASNMRPQGDASCKNSPPDASPKFQSPPQPIAIEPTYSRANNKLTYPPKMRLHGHNEGPEGHNEGPEGHNKKMLRLCALLLLAAPALAIDLKTAVIV